MAHEHGKPEVLAPAGDADAMRAAVRSGADAVYFGLKGPNFNARARAANFDIAELPDTMRMLHAHGVKGFVTLNTLVFDHELSAMEETIRACAAAGVDAVIVQDLGVVQLVKAIAPTLEVHASTQMTCTDASSVQLAVDMGASRVVVARELSVEEIAKIREATGAELEVFVHGALCVSYSGQCLTSEAIGGRSANRGACAQACRLPYDLVVDGKVQDLGDVAYLLSPQDLEASALVSQLARVGVASLKIEGRLKGPEYVASATKLYRAAVDGGDIDARRADTLATYSRGSGPGFLAGVNHQALVEGKTCDHRGVHVATVRSVERRGNKQWLIVNALEPIAKGAGVVVEGAKAGAGERGGRVWDVDSTPAGGTPAPPLKDFTAALWLGPDVSLDGVVAGRRVFKNDDPAIDARVLNDVERAPHREPIDLIITGKEEDVLVVRARSARGLVALANGDTRLVKANERPLDEAMLREKLGQLGDTPYTLRDVTIVLEGDLAVPPSSLKRLRRHLVEALTASAKRAHETTNVHVDDVLARAGIEVPPPPAGLFVLCRTQAQADAAYDAGADGVWLDFLALNGTRAAVDALRARVARVTSRSASRRRAFANQARKRSIVSFSTFRPTRSSCADSVRCARSRQERGASPRPTWAISRSTSPIASARPLSLRVASLRSRRRSTSMQGNSARSSPRKPASMRSSSCIIRCRSFTPSTACSRR